ncbi:MAG: DUF2892 domain-containing protein [Bacteroidota bacterium]
MKTNIGSLDKAIRIGSAIAICILILCNTISDAIAIAALIIGLSLAITGIISHSPVYSIFNINTKKNLNDKAYSSYRNQRQFNQVSVNKK